VQTWKDEKMVLAGRKAQITKLKNLGRVDEARKLEETLMNTIEMPKPALPKLKLRHIKVSYDVPCVCCESENNLPWIERYRPATLADLVGEVGPYLRAFVMTNSFPLSMVFYGDYGQGKTAAARAFVRDYYVKQQVFKPEAVWKDVLNGANWTEEYEGCWSPVLNIDATLNAEVEVVREKVQNFMKVRAMWNAKGLGLKKFAVFDEADRLGYASQGALRSLLEKYPGTVTIYMTNKIESVDPAIVSRASGGVFEFQKPELQSLVDHLKRILRTERKTLSVETIEEIAVASQSVREAVGRLQQEVAVESVE